MPFVGLVGAPISYAEWAAARAGSTALAPIAEGVSLAAIAGILGEGALLLGAGYAGYAIGSYILSQIAPMTVYPPPDALLKIGVPGERYHVSATSKLTTEDHPTLFENDFDAPIIIPVRREVAGGEVTQGAKVGATFDFVGYTTSLPEQIEIPLKVTSVTKLPGGAPVALKPTPSFPPYEPLAPKKVPYIVPVPGNPDGFPITPTLVPNPDNDPDVDDEQPETGVNFQIPETGQQFKFTPSGVSITNYRSPAVTPDPEPKVPLPPTFPPPATEPCPCPDSKTDLSEVIRRLKDLENCERCEQYTYSSELRASGNSNTVTALTDEPLGVTMTLVAQPSNVRTQSGGDNSPEVVFSGWFAPIVDGVPGSRTQIHYATQYFPLDKTATGYLFCGITGCSYTSVYHSRKRTEPPDPG